VTLQLFASPVVSLPSRPAVLMLVHHDVGPSCTVQGGHVLLLSTQHLAHLFLPACCAVPYSRFPPLFHIFFYLPHAAPSQHIVLQHYDGA